MTKSQLALLPTKLLVALTKQEQNRSRSFDKLVRFILSNRFASYPTYLLCGMSYDEEEIVRSCASSALTYRLTTKEELFEVNCMFDILSSMDLDLVWHISVFGKSEVVRRFASSIVLNHLDERGYFKEEDHKVLRKKGKDYYDKH